MLLRVHDGATFSLRLRRSLKSKEGCGAAAPVVGIGGSTRTSKEEANPLLLAAYDLLTCTAGSVGSPSASLPKSLSEFLSSQDLRRQRQTGWGRESARHGDKGRFENSASARNAMEHSAASLGPEDEDWGSQEALDEAGEVLPQACFTSFNSLVTAVASQYGFYSILA